MENKESKNSKETEKTEEEKDKVEELEETLPKKKNLYERYKQDLSVSKFTMNSAIHNIEDWVKNGENQRNYKMKSEFDREKEYKLEEQTEIKNQIEELARNNINEKLINHFNEKINQQQDLYNKYYEMREEVIKKINYLKETIPELEMKVKSKSDKLKELNKENLKLMDQISQIEKNQSLHLNNSSMNLNTSLGINNNSINETLFGNNNNQTLNEKIPNSINISEIVEENEEIRNQYNKIIQLKKLHKQKKKENEHLMKAITEMNSDCFTFKKIFNEGLHEIAKELLKIHEIQLDKVISNNKNNNINNGNSLYFEIVKGNINGNQIKNDTTLKLPIINNNIRKKYGYPIEAKSNPSRLVYKVIKNMVDESHNLSKVVNMKKNKFSWEEFKNFSAYQIYTILNLNKDIIKMLESNIFPRKIIFPNNEEQQINEEEK